MMHFIQEWGGFALFIAVVLVLTILIASGKIETGAGLRIRKKVSVSAEGKSTPRQE